MKTTVVGILTAFLLAGCMPHASNFTKGRATEFIRSQGLTVDEVITTDSYESALICKNDVEWAVIVVSETATSIVCLAEEKPPRFVARG